MNTLTVDWEKLIHDEIADRSIPRASIAQTYAYLILGGNRDWRAINREIFSRFSASGLNWIKREAWKRVEQERTAARAGDQQPGDEVL